MFSFFVLIDVIVVLAVSGAAILILWSRISDEAANRNRSNWSFPFYATVGTLIIFVLLVTVFSLDGGEILYVFLVIPIVSINLLVIAFLKWKHLHNVILSMLVVFLLASWVLLKNDLEVRSDVRWIFVSKDYKAKVQAQPVPANGELRHIEWDGWGFAGIDTEVYLVFDPTDALAMAVKSHSSGKFSGVPCQVDRVSRLESHYYTVLFYTNSGWDSCNY
jgi:hypothetical protein